MQTTTGARQKAEPTYPVGVIRLTCTGIYGFVEGIYEGLDAPGRATVTRPDGSVKTIVLSAQGYDQRSGATVWMNQRTSDWWMGNGIYTVEGDNLAWVGIANSGQATSLSCNQEQ